MKITYLLGAGASANAVPVLKEFNPVLRAFLDEIKAKQGSLLSPSQAVAQKDFDEMTSRLLKDWAVLWEELDAHANVDVYARQLYLTNESVKQRQLKALVSAFLVFHQLENKPDKRYDHFMASILEKNDKLEINFPMELMILSWNYDFQLEMAASRYFRKNKVQEVQEIMNLYPKVQLQDLEREILNKFSVIKLNGTVAGSQPDDNSFLPLPILFNTGTGETPEAIPADKLRSLRLSDAVLHYHRFTDPNTKLTSNIMYAWEITPIQKKIRSYIRFKSYNTDVLVVTGYSFPTFNRRTDRELLANMQLLKEVCIQAPADSIQSVAERFYALLGPERVLGMGKSNNPVKVRFIEMKSEKLDDEFYVPFQATSF